MGKDVVFEFAPDKRIQTVSLDTEASAWFIAEKMRRPILPGRVIMCKLSGVYSISKYIPAIDKGIDRYRIGIRIFKCFTP
jgi:hypothetical protein